MAGLASAVGTRGSVSSGRPSSRVSVGQNLFRRPAMRVNGCREPQRGIEPAVARRHRGAREKVEDGRGFQRVRGHGIDHQRRERHFQSAAHRCGELARFAGGQLLGQRHDHERESAGIAEQVTNRARILGQRAFGHGVEDGLRNLQHQRGVTGGGPSNSTRS